MREFDLQLLRLKQAIGVTEDQDAAAALGMTKAAFSERKRRGAFPAEKLFALEAKNDYPGLDATYVLTGKRLSPRERAKASNMHRLVAEFPGLSDADREVMAGRVAQGTRRHVDAVKRRAEKLDRLQSLLDGDDDDRLLDSIIRLVETTIERSKVRQ